MKSPPTGIAVFGTLCGLLVLMAALDAGQVVAATDGAALTQAQVRAFWRRLFGLRGAPFYIALMVLAFVGNLEKTSTHAANHPHVPPTVRSPAPVVLASASTCGREGGGCGTGGGCGSGGCGASGGSACGCGTKATAPAGTGRSQPVFVAASSSSAPRPGVPRTEPAGSPGSKPPAMLPVSAPLGSQTKVPGIEPASANAGAVLPPGLVARKTGPAADMAIPALNAKPKLPIAATPPVRQTESPEPAALNQPADPPAPAAANFAP